MLKKVSWQRAVFLSLAVLLVAGYGFLLFYKLGSHPIVDWDEGIYAQVARQSFENKTIANLHWYGSISPQNPTGLWFEKPPLMIWLTEFSYLIFGVTEFAARFWNAFFALGVVVLSYFFTVRLFKSQTIGLLTLASYYLAHFFITQAWYLKFDIPVTFFILLAIFAFELAKDNKKWLLLFWLSMGLGVLTKSVIGLLPLPIIGLYTLICKNYVFLKERYFYYGILLFFAVILPWHLIETVRFGLGFWKIYLGLHVLERYARPLENNGGSFWYYALQMKENLLLACLAVLGLVSFLRKIIVSKENRNGHVLIVICVMFIFLFFSAAGTKIISYIVVVYPFLIIMIAKTIHDIFYWRYRTEEITYNTSFPGRGANTESVLPVSAPRNLFLSKNYLFRALGLTAVSLLFIISAFIYNNSKINNNGYYAHYYYEDKAFMQLALQYYPNLNILIYHRDAPALIFYANKRIYSWSSATKISPGSLIFISSEQPPYSDAKLLAKGQTASLYLITIQK